MTRAISIFVAAALAGATLAAAQPAPAPNSATPPPSGTLVEVSAKAREARLKGDVATWLDYATRTLALTPDHPDILISVARANAAAGNKAEALDHLAQAARRGAGVDPARFAEFKALAGDAQFEAVTADARRNLEPVARASVFADIPDKRSEGIAFDPVSRRLFAGTETGELLAITMDGKVATFASGEGLRQVLGLKVDPERRLLWLVNGRYPEPTPDGPPDMGTGGVRAYDLESGALVTRVEIDELPIQHGFNDIALGADGTVYVTDSHRQSVYKLAPGGKQLELFLRDTRMSFPNGLVLSPEGKTLYVAHTEGISAIDLATKARRLLPVPADGSVNSIDGLLLHAGTFYGVQNSPYMNRIVAAKLSEDGKSIARVWTLSSHTPPEYSQTTAAIASGDLYMIGGTPMPDVYGGTNPAPPVRRIWRVPLGAN